MNRDAERLARIPGIGDTLAATLARRGIRTRAQLRAIAGELPAETQVHLRYDIARAIPLAVGAAVAAEMGRRLTFRGASGRRRKFPTFAVGSIRREAPASKDIDILVVVPDGLPLAVFQDVLASAELGGAGPCAIAETYAVGARRRSFVVRRAGRGGAKYYAVDLFLATASEKPYALFHYSNGRDYNIRVRAHAKRKNLKLDQYGVFVAGTTRRAPGSAGIKSERDLARFLGVTYRAPRERGNL